MTHKTEKNMLIEFEDELVRLWEQGRIKVPVHFCGGNEDKLVEVFKDIKQEDYVFGTHRNHYHYLLKGGVGNRLRDKIVDGRDGGSMVTLKPLLRFYTSAIVGGMCAIAVGVAWGIKEKGGSSHVWCFVGDGALDGGHFWEALIYAEGQDLPVTFVVEDNNQSTCSSKAVRRGKFPTICDLVHTKTRKCKVYYYQAKHPHVGSGKYVQF